MRHFQRWRIPTPHPALARHLPLKGKALIDNSPRELLRAGCFVHLVIAVSITFRLLSNVSEDPAVYIQNMPVHEIRSGGG